MEHKDDWLMGLPTQTWNSQVEYWQAKWTEEYLRVCARNEAITWAADKLKKLAELIEADGPNPKYDAATVREIYHALTDSPKLNKPQQIAK